MGRADSKNYYDLLGMMPSASMAELKRAFREKAKSFHPDLNPDEEALATFRAIQEAYNILRDPVERTFYDRGLGLKSNWVEEAAKDSERRRATRVTGDARTQADDAESQARPRRAARERPTERPTAGPADAGPTARGPDRSSDEAASSGATGSASTGPTSSAGAESGPSSRQGRATAGSEGASSGPQSRSSFRAQDSGTSRRSRYSSRFGGSSRASTAEAPRPSETYPPPPQAKLPWYRDRPLRIFVFVTSILATLALFFTDPTRGIYFLVLAFGIEGLYRLEDLKQQGMRPPPFRPPPRT